MIQLLINLDKDSAKIIRCDGLIASIEIPVDLKEANPKLGLICDTPSMLAIIRSVVEACEEATERGELARRMGKLELMMNGLSKKPAGD